MKKILFLLAPFLSFAQQIDKVDFIKCHADVAPQFDTRIVNGVVTYEFKVKSEIDSIRIDAKNMTFSEVKINGKSVNYKNNNKELVLFEGFKKGKNKLNFGYQAKPKQTMYFTGIGEGQQIWTQGQGKYTSHWFPSFDDVNEKVIFNMTVSFDKRYQVLSNGILKHEYPNKNEMIWEYHMEKPMSSYLLALAIGDFRNKVISSKSGVPLQLFIQPKDTMKFDYTYKDSKIIFDFLEKEIGVKYPWKVYRQIPVCDFLYAGMENTTSTIFAQDYVVDESGFNDRNYINVNAHELAHQWFGDLITAKSGKHHWLQEGFATYYALLAERKVFGDAYFYNALYRNSMLLRKEAKIDTIPVMNEKASSYSFYQKGAWALHVIHEAIGREKFQKAVKNYLKKYQFKNVETDDFLNEIAKVSDFDIVKFKKEWLEDYHFPGEQANALLKKNDFIKTLFEIQSYRNKMYADKEAFFTKIMSSNADFQLKKEIIYQVAQVPFEEKRELIYLAMQTNSVEVRQAVAETISVVPKNFREEYETLLNDKSYTTKQIAFIRLWDNFPEEQSRYLELAKDWTGNNDKELRIIFLKLYQDFKDADPNKKQIYWQELVDYTSPKYESSVRENAIENALLIQPKDALVLKNLVNATTHHKWQFVKYGRDKIRLLLKQEEYLSIFESLLPSLSESEQFQLNRLLDEVKVKK